MSWIGRQLGRKRGGTRLGNLIRQAAYNNTGGLFGRNLGGYLDIGINNGDGSGYYGVNPDIEA